MEQKLNIKLLENQDCCFTAVDSTSIPVDGSNQINRAFIEFVIKDGSIIFNLVNEVVNATDLSTSTTITIDSDGLYKYYKIVIPTLEYYRGGNSSYNIVTDGVARCFYYNQKIYKPNLGVSQITLDTLDANCTKINSVMDMWALREIDDNILYYDEEYFTICRLRNCFLNRLGESVLDLAKRGCNTTCAPNYEVETKRDFMFATIYVLNWLICKKDFEEAKRILSIVVSCDNYLCPSDSNIFNTLGGCNCGKS